MDAGLRKNFSDTEIIRAVLRIIKPGVFKDMLINKDDMMANELKEVYSYIWEIKTAWNYSRNCCALKKVILRHLSSSYTV